MHRRRRQRGRRRAGRPADDKARTQTQLAALADALNRSAAILESASR